MRRWVVSARPFFSYISLFDQEVQDIIRIKNVAIFINHNYMFTLKVAHARKLSDSTSIRKKYNTFCHI